MIWIYLSQCSCWKIFFLLKLSFIPKCISIHVVLWFKASITLSHYYTDLLLSLSFLYLLSSFAITFKTFHYRFSFPILFDNEGIFRHFYRIHLPYLFIKSIFSMLINSQHRNTSSLHYHSQVVNLFQRNDYKICHFRLTSHN